MLTTAKIFKHGNRQAVRLPKAFRREGDEVWISTNEGTGEIMLTPKPTPDSLDTFFTLLEAEPSPRDFLAKRHNLAVQPVLREWSEKR